MNMIQMIMITELTRDYNVLSMDGPVNKQRHDMPCYALQLGDGQDVRVYESGLRCWYRNNVYHREDGPAIEYSAGDIDWWLNGVQMFQEEHAERMQWQKDAR